jgi:uncharacterized protein
MEILGYFGAFVMGIFLGMIGGGGSILTLPILVYLFSIETVFATAYSLFIVGLTSLVGSISHIIKGNIHWKTALVFGIPSVASVYLTRLFLVPYIPDVLFSFRGFQLTKALFMLLLFALLMVLAAITMIREPITNSGKASAEISYNYSLILLEGTVVGLVSGLVGAGGGFLIIPTLVLLVKLPMKMAIGTSLIIIALKSLLGFLGDVKVPHGIDWPFLSLFSGLAILGILTGTIISQKIPSKKLKPIFGYFVLVMGLFIIIKELIFN